MLTKYDEFLCHQTVSTFNSVSTSAREWTERIWFSVHDTVGKYQMISGFGYYPNRNIMDAFACFVVENKTLYAVRASRVLRPRIDEVSVGPLSYDIVEPMKQLKCILAENEHKLSFEIDFHATMPAHEEDAQYTEEKGRALENIKRYVQVGKPSGWIKYEGETVRIDQDSWRCERDHSWGIRRGGGVPETGVQPSEYPEGYLHNFVLLQFDDWGATYHTREDWDSNTLHFSGSVFYPFDSTREPDQLISVDHKFTFKQDIRQIDGGNMTLNAEDSSKIDITIHPLSACYLQAGGYFGYEGFTHGLWLGENYLDGLKLDLTDPGEIKKLSFLDDVVCKATCGDRTGYGIVELVVIGRYPKYGYTGY